MGIKIGYFSIGDALSPSGSLELSIAAEKTGFDTLWVEDHLIAMPGGTECNFAWTVMSSSLQATRRVPFITGVTAPIMRYHPAIVAQAFATMGAMYPGRVGLGVGTGEPPNEMAVYRGEWPSNATRLEMLEEALTLIHRLWTSDTPVSYAGKYYTLNKAVLLTKPKVKIPVYVSAIGPRAAELAGRLGDHVISIANNPRYIKDELWPAFESSARAAGKDPRTMERVGHFSYIYDPDGAVNPDLIQQEAGTIQGGAMSKAFASQIITVFHSAEDCIKKIEEMERMGYTHLAVADQRMALPKEHRPTLSEVESLNFWKDVFPHVR
ncbi:MAG: LLM class flavin-dependent oxidoreductase [Methanolinea sp.]|nr:LLM class flavin-dependent oxidoreductase [Methanolinea sp.]